jgi:THO complex subunit 7
MYFTFILHLHTFVQVIQSKLKEAESDIAEAKSELEQARLVRRNRMEYDAVAKTIQAYPSRQESGKNIADVTAHLERLKEEEEELDAKLQQRKKQFHVLVNSIHQLQVST